MKKEELNKKKELNEKELNAIAAAGSPYSPYTDKVPSLSGLPQNENEGLEKEVEIMAKRAENR